MSNSSALHIAVFMRQPIDRVVPVPLPQLRHRHSSLFFGEICLRRVRPLTHRPTAS
jgi:hypothetical protein